MATLLANMASHLNARRQTMKNQRHGGWKANTPRNRMIAKHDLPRRLGGSWEHALGRPLLRVAPDADQRWIRMWGIGHRLRQAGRSGEEQERL